MPKISVILTSYNHDNYINEAIDSVLNQTFTDFELIIWDDGSTDNSWYLINQYTDVRIKAFRNDTNEGPVFGINKAISEIATGDYIAIHHSDDVWELSKLEKQLAFLEANQEVGAVFTWTQIIDEQGKDLHNDHFIQENKSRWQWLHELFIGDNHLNHPSLLIRKQCYQEVGLYRHSLAQTPDAEMWSRVLIQFPIHIIQEKLTKHRLFTDNSNTSGIRIDVKIRTSNEWNIIRENFLALNHFDDIVAIFPSLERYRNSAGFNNKFLLAMACLYDCKQKNAWLLGLTWLFELINHPVHYPKIIEFYEFYYTDLIKLTAEFDVYGIESVFLADLQVEVENLRTGNAWLELQRREWENTAIERERFIEELRVSNEELQSGNAWLELQRRAWENTAIEREQFIEELRASNEKLQSDNAWLESQRRAWENTAIERERFIDELRAGNEELQSGNAWLESQRAAWENTAIERERFIEELRAGNEELRAGNEELRAGNEELQSGNALLELQCAAWENTAIEKHTLINKIYASHSWKLTKPLRFFARVIIPNPKT